MLSPNPVTLQLPLLTSKASTMFASLLFKPLKTTATSHHTSPLANRLSSFVVIVEPTSVSFISSMFTFMLSETFQISKTCCYYYLVNVQNVILQILVVKNQCQYNVKSNNNPIIPIPEGEVAKKLCYIYNYLQDYTVFTLREDFS